MTTTTGPTSPIPQVQLAPAPAADAAPAIEVDALQTATETSVQPKGKRAPKAKRAPKSKGKQASSPAALDPAGPAKKKGASRAKTAAAASLAVGGSPKVDLLPLSIRVLDQQKRSRRNMRFAALGIAVVVVAGIGAAWYENMTAQQELAVAHANSVSLLQQQTKYSDLVNAKQQIDITAAAQAVGGSTDVDWRAYLASLQSTLPAGVVIKTVTIDAATPGAVYEQSSTPLEGARVATLSFSAISPTLPDVPRWLDGLRTLNAFVDATPNSVRLDDANGMYQVDITMHVSADVYSHRFAATGTDAQ